MKPLQTEKAFQRAVIDLARWTGWRCFYVIDSRGSPSGWPDLTLCNGDRLIFRELKLDKGRVSEEQRIWGEFLVRAGMDYAIWRPADWSTITATLQGQGQQETGGAA